jgi:hypothetical protein
MSGETNRRHFVAGLAAAPAVVIGGLPATPAVASTLETLLTAETRLNALDARIDALWPEIDRAGLAARRALGKHRVPVLEQW